MPSQALAPIVSCPFTVVTGFPHVQVHQLEIGVRIPGVSACFMPEKRCFGVDHLAEPPLDTSSVDGVSVHLKIIQLIGHYVLIVHNCKIISSPCRQVLHSDLALAHTIAQGFMGSSNLSLMLLTVN